MCPWNIVLVRVAGFSLWHILVFFSCLVFHVMMQILLLRSLEPCVWPPDIFSSVCFLWMRFLWQVQSVPWGSWLEQQYREATFTICRTTWAWGSRHHKGRCLLQTEQEEWQWGKAMQGSALFKQLAEPSRKLKLNYNTRWVEIALALSMPPTPPQFILAIMHVGSVNILLPPLPVLEVHLIWPSGWGLAPLWSSSP